MWVNSFFLILDALNAGEHKETTEVPGDYLLAEVRRLARLVLVKTPRPSDWRSSHPYLLIDRLEDITDETIVNSEFTSDRRISLYGWVRGTPLPPVLKCSGIHIAGLGDFVIAECSRQPDPCPLPRKFSSFNNESEIPARHLSERDRKVCLY